ncbi:MAG: hypothetical protein JWQ09_2553 [Segetibacter sp.]|nr:hypothetical protein [Segetibacter sp.]
MEQENYIQRKEAETMRKLHAFQLFRESGIEIIEQSFSNLKGFILANEHKSYDELEKELLAQLAYTIEKV